MKISVPLYDSHIHLFRNGFHETYDEKYAREDELAVYESLRAVHNIERALVVGYEGDLQFEGNNGDIAKWAKEREWIAPLAYYDAENAPSFSPANAERDGIFVGISLYLMAPEKAQALAQWPRETIEDLNKKFSIISVNAEPGVLSEAQPFFERAENCFILISHLGMPGAFREPPSKSEAARIMEPLKRLSALPNTGVKLSGLYGASEPAHDYPHRSAHPFLQQLRDDFGSERLFWGSDFSPALEHVSFAQTIAALDFFNWTEAETNAIMGENLRRILSSNSAERN
jgi:L-fuconolactonase